MLADKPRPQYQLTSVLVMAPLLLLSMATPPAALAKRRADPPPAATVATFPVTATTAVPAATPWHMSFDPNKLTSQTLLQTMDTLLHSAEVQTLMRVAAFVFFMYIVTRRPDPATGKPSPDPFSAVTKSWLITQRKEGGSVQVVVDPASLPTPAVATGTSTAPAKAVIPSPKTGSGSRSSTNSSSNGTSGRSSPPASSSAGGGRSNDVTAARATTPSGSATTPAGSPEPGVIGLGLTAAAIDALAPLGKFVVSEMMSTMAALSSSSSSSSSSNAMPSSSSNGAAAVTATTTASSSNGAAPPAQSAAAGPAAAAAANQHVVAAQQVAAAQQAASLAVMPSAPAPLAPAAPEAGSLAAQVREPWTGVKLVDWAVNKTQNVRRHQQKQEQQQQQAVAMQAQAQGASPLRLDPRYPPSRAQHPPRPVSLLTQFRMGSGTSGSEQVSGRGWAQGVYPVAPLLPTALPDLDVEMLAAATVSSVVALNLAIVTGQRVLPDLVPSPPLSAPSAAAPLLTPAGERRVSQVVSFNLAEAARKLVAQRAQQLADKEAAAAALAEAAAAKLAAAAPPPFALRPPAVAASAPAAPAASAWQAGTGADATSSTNAGASAAAVQASVPPPASAGATSVGAQAVAVASGGGAGRVARAGPQPTLIPRVVPRSLSPDALRPAATEVDGSVLFTRDQLQSVEVVIEEVRSKLRESSRSPSPRQEGSGASSPAPRQQEAVDRWTEMIQRSPSSAADAVAEVHAVAQAVMEDVRGSLQAVDSELGGEGGSVTRLAESLAARADLANETADALLAGRQAAGLRKAWAPWAWAWGLGSGDEPSSGVSSSGLADFLDPIKGLLSLKPPTVRSKYDPLTSLNGGWTAIQEEALPNWDPLQRLRALRQGGPGQSRGASAGSGAGPALSFEPSKYDGVTQLWSFLAGLPQLVEGAEWAAAAAQDPLRLLIANAAGRSESRVLQARAKIQKLREAAAGGLPKKKRSRWSKYDPLDGLFSPEVPLGRQQICDEVVSEMLALESVSGPLLKQPFSPLKVMGTRGGQAFGAALLDFKSMAVTDEGAARLRRHHPALAAWLQSASNVALATVASGTKLGPVWGVLLLPRSNYQSTLQAAKQALPAFLRELERRHPGLWALLRQRDPEQALVLLATLAAWVVADSMAATGKPPRALTPAPADAASVASKVPA